MGSSPAPRTPPAQACLAGHASNRLQRPGTRPHRGSAAPHSQKGIYPPAGRGGQRARVDLRSRPGRAVRLAHIAAAPPQAPQCGHQRARRGPSTEHGGERRGAARPPPMHEGPAAACSAQQPGETQAPRGRPHCSARRARPGAWPWPQPRRRGGDDRAAATAVAAAAAAEAPVQVASGALTFGAEREVKRAVPCCCHSAARPCAMPGEATAGD